jgi:hypothetical protein
MAQGLRAVQTEEIRQRRVSMQKLMDIQKVRRSVIQTVLHYHATYERNLDKWSTMLEDSFWLKQPVTPFRSFRRSEVERVCVFSVASFYYRVLYAVSYDLLSTIMCLKLTL